MNDYDKARLLQLHVDAMEIHCIVEGMVAFNQNDVQNGMVPTHLGDVFTQSEDALKNISDQMGDIINAYTK